MTCQTRAIRVESRRYQPAFVVMELTPSYNKRYELIDGELYISKQPHWFHQLACARLAWILLDWCDRSGLGIANMSPGMVVSEYDQVIPDVVWISNERFANALDDNGHLRIAPELIAEVLSPGDYNQRRDRQSKHALYSRCHVSEYWIVDWQVQQVEIYRHSQTGLVHVTSISHEESLTSPLLPGFSCQVAQLFHQIQKPQHL